MQRAAEQYNQKQSTHFGGIFAPLAQYPGASYAEILSEKFVSQAQKSPHYGLREKNVVRSGVHYVKYMQKNNLPFNTALLLVDVESNSSLDRSILRDAGIARVRVFTSGLQAAKFLSAKQETDAQELVDIVFCHPRFEDMSAVQWIELIRSHPALKQLPVVALAGNHAEERLLQAVLGGFDELLTRPYSPKSLQEKLRQMHYSKSELSINSTVSPDFDQALKRFELCKTEDGKAKFNMEEGLRYMQQKQWDLAIQSFNKAIVNQSYKGDAELGLAAAWRGKQDLEKFRYYLYEAALTFTRSEQWAKARSAYAHALKIMPKTPSPFVRTMQSLIRAGKYSEAATTLLEGIELSKHEHISRHIAKACLYTENPPFTLKKVKEYFTDPLLLDAVKSIDSDLQQAFAAHQDNVNRNREEKARLEQKAKDYLKNKQSKTRSIAGEDESADLVLGLVPLVSQQVKKITSKNKVEADSILEEIPGDPTLMEDDYIKRHNNAAIPLMDEDDLESQLFTGFPGLNEAATVIKTTWKLMKK